MVGSLSLPVRGGPVAGAPALAPGLARVRPLTGPRGAARQGRAAPGRLDSRIRRVSCNELRIKAPRSRSIRLSRDYDHLLVAMLDPAQIVSQKCVR